MALDRAYSMSTGGHYSGGSTGGQRRATAHPLKATDPQRAASAEGRDREGQRGGRKGRQGWGWYGRAAEREVGRVQQRRASGAGRGQQGKGMRRWGSGMARINTRVSLATTLLRRSPLAAFVAATASSSTPPPPIHLRISVALLAPKAFLATAFLMLGRRNVWFYELLWNGILRGVGKRGGCAWAWYTWSMVFTSHQEPGSLISGRGWRCPTVVCSWSPVTLGPAFELVTLRGGFGRRRGSLSLGWSWSHWIWSMRMVHSLAASEHTAVCNQLWQGAHTLLGEHFECVRRAAQGASYEGGTCTRRGFECISVAAQARWRSGPDGGTRRRCSTYIAGGRGI